MFPSSPMFPPAPYRNPRVDQYDSEGRFIGRTGGIEGTDYGVGSQDNDFLGNALAAYGRQFSNGGQGSSTFYLPPSAEEQKAALMDAGNAVAHDTSGALIDNPIAKKNPFGGQVTGLAGNSIAKNPF